VISSFPRDAAVSVPAWLSRSTYTNAPTDRSSSRPGTPVTPHTSTTPLHTPAPSAGGQKGREQGKHQATDEHTSQLACLLLFLLNPLGHSSIPSSVLFVCVWLGGYLQQCLAIHVSLAAHPGQPELPEPGSELVCRPALSQHKPTLLVLPGAEPDQPASTPTLMASHLSQNTTTC
jgi:hypothetical protein